MIVAAALIMGTVFAAFILSADRIPKEFGLLLAVAILTDALARADDARAGAASRCSARGPGTSRAGSTGCLPNITIEPPHDGDRRDAPVDDERPLETAGPH